ncbi:carboxymuconolactone decarboxylase family protein [Herminiimonas fonticola]|uniref:carboxymuconolactone decarboxylase family protein n=1 Tax=Herminiimonas fonticola TaxID=303380 RepID=UPI0033422ED8
MSKDYQVITSDIVDYIRQMKPLIPGTMKGFYEMSAAASADGALEKKTKEFIALAIGVAIRCDGCIGFHSKALRDLGATRNEVAEVLGMAVYMGGGPSLMYAADALRAYDQFAAAS